MTIGPAGFGQAPKSYRVRPIMDEPEDTPGDLPNILPLDVVIRRHVVATIEACGNNVTLAAERLGVTRFWVHRRLREWGLKIRRKPWTWTTRRIARGRR